MFTLTIVTVLKIDKIDILTWMMEYIPFPRMKVNEHLYAKHSITAAYTKLSIF